jgi:hypothetical protein
MKSINNRYRSAQIRYSLDNWNIKKIQQNKKDKNLQIQEKSFIFSKKKKGESS